MTPAQALLDTDILSAIMRREPAAVAQARNYLSVYSQLAISIITRYEILRGLNAKRATAQLAKFEILCASLQILPLTDAIIVGQPPFTLTCISAGNSSETPIF